MSESSNVSVSDALEVFARGYSFTRSFTYPSIPEKLDSGVWVVRDAPRTNGDYRGEEYVASGLDPGQLHEIAMKHARGRYSIWSLCPAGESDAPMRAGFKALGYRLLRTEPLMVNDLSGLPEVPEPVPVSRVTAIETAAKLAKAARRRQILPEHIALDPAPQRQYVAVDGDAIIGWVASIVAGEYTWCSSMFVEPEYRRRGIARALLSRMLRDDRDAGSKANVLLASHAGAKLYPVVGYVQIGELYGFMPKRGL